MFYVYILYSHSVDKYYVGHTADVEKRLWEHNNPIGKSKYTAKFFPWEMVLHFPVSPARADAMKIEKFIKSQKSKIYILKLIENRDNSEYFQKLVNKINFSG